MTEVKIKCDLCDAELDSNYISMESTGIIYIRLNNGNVVRPLKKIKNIDLCESCVPKYFKEIVCVLKVKSKDIES